MAAGLDSAGLAGADLGGVLASLGTLSGKLAAARAAVLSRFDAARGHDADGYGSSASWLAAKGRTTRQAAGAEVRRMRQFRAHPVIAAAVARGELSDGWAVKIADWTRKLPPDWRDEIDKLLVDTAAAGAELEDLAIVAQAAWEKWRQQQGPDPDDGDGGYDDRYLKLATTIDGVGRVNGNLTGECAAAVQAVLEALGKKASPDDDRSEAQRYHDALQEACELLLAARLVPGRPHPHPRRRHHRPVTAALPARRAGSRARLPVGTGRRARPPVRRRRPGRRLRRHHQPRRHRPPRPVRGGQDDRHRAGLPRHHRGSDTGGDGDTGDSGTADRGQPGRRAR